MDGNAEQVRRIATQIMEAAEGREKPLREEFQRLEQSLDSKIAAAVHLSENKLKLWVIGGVLTQLVAALPVIFFLGGIYNTNNSALDMLRKQQTILDQHSEWMYQRERWGQAVELWGEPKGLRVPTDRRTIRGD